MKGDCIRRLNGFRIYIFIIASGLRDRESQELYCRGQHTSVAFEFQLKCTIIRYMGFTTVKTHISVTRK